MHLIAGGDRRLGDLQGEVDVLASQDAERATLRQRARSQSERLLQKLVISSMSAQLMTVLPTRSATAPNLQR